MKSLFQRFAALILLVALVALGGVIAKQHGPVAGFLAVSAVAAAVVAQPSRKLGIGNGSNYTLLDLAARSGQHTHALIEGVLTTAPEMAVLPTFPKQGLNYTVRTRTELPSGDFHQVGGGVGLSKSKWKSEVGSMSLFSAQMRVGEDFLLAERAENPEVTEGMLLASEAIAHVRGSGIKLCNQTWYGKKISADGFVGLSTQVDASNIINAGGANNVDTCSVYLVYLAEGPVNPDGVHYLLGNGGSMSFGEEWGRQQIEVEAGKYANVKTNSFSAFLGLVAPRDQNVYQVKNVKADNAFTDAVAAELLSKVPQALKVNKGRWRFFMNGTAKYLLQKSRSATGQVASDSKGGGQTAPEPTDVAGIQIVETDSLISTERNGAKV
jgi:hypothetical protein